MSEVTVTPYIYFKGQAREAMEFYKSVFGGTLDVVSYADMPDVEGVDKDWLMHAALYGGDAHLFASDTTGASAKAAKIELALGGDNELRLREIFGKLSEGGEIKRPIQKEAWGDLFGALQDKYGIEWMVNITVAKAA
ncbi:MAG TPA: VOC family protein [Candidatus Saccharimonadales bacterium]|nr:VOC family protein [Candidatus Saccharimonadales bacterium]